MTLTIEQMEFLASKGLTIADVIEFSRLADGVEHPVPTERSQSAERQARYRARKKQTVTDTVTHSVTRYVTPSVTGDVTHENVTPFPAPPNENNLTPPTHTPVNTTTRARGSDFPMLDCTDAATWRDFLANRKAKRQPNTASAHKKLVADLARIASDTGQPPGEIFAACVAKGWGAIYDPTKEKFSGKSTANDSDEPRNPYVVAVVARQAARAAGQCGQSDSWP